MFQIVINVLAYHRDKLITIFLASVLVLCIIHQTSL
jgi:hypothetical protein